jgi:hypothetical protein
LAFFCETKIKGSDAQEKLIKKPKIKKWQGRQQAPASVLKLPFR